jgi:predicted transcriptional regulator
MKISEIKDILKAEVLTGEDQLENAVEGAGGADLMNDVLAAATAGALLLTGLTTEQVLRTAKVAGVSCIVFVRGKKPDEHVLDLARTYTLPLLLTQYSLFVACGRLYMNGLRGLDGSW